MGISSGVSSSASFSLLVVDQARECADPDEILLIFLPKDNQGEEQSKKSANQKSSINVNKSYHPCLVVPQNGPAFQPFPEKISMQSIVTNGSIKSTIIINFHIFDSIY